MNAWIVPEAGRLELRDIAAPVISPYQALVKIEACGICNMTDCRLIDDDMNWAPPFPFILGHESVGAVIEVGDKVRKFHIGDRVTRPIAFAAGSRADLNVANGGFAQLGIVTDAEAMAQGGDASLSGDYNARRQCLLPRSLDPILSVLAISLSETASVLTRLPNLRGNWIAVLGSGVAGLSFALWAKLAGAHVIVLGRRTSRLERARQVGADQVLDTREPHLLERIADAAGGRLDGAIDATGDTRLANSVLSAISGEGFAVAYGIASGGAFDARWQIAPVEEQTTLGWVADLLLRGWVKPDWFLTHTWSFDDLPLAFAQVRAGEVLKGVVKISD